MLLSVRLTKCRGEVASLPSYAAVFFELSPGGFLVRPNEQTDLAVQILRCFNFFATRRHFFFFFSLTLKRKERADIATEAFAFVPALVRGPRQTRSMFASFLFFFHRSIVGQNLFGPNVRGGPGRW